MLPGQDTPPKTPSSRPSPRPLTRGVSSYTMLRMRSIWRGTGSPRVDVHSHFLPAEYLAAMQRAGVTDVDGFPLPSWNVEAHLEAMDRYGVAMSLLSISSPGLRFVQGETARRLARSVNQTARGIIDEHPQRFGAFALLPLPDVDGALAEIQYALDVLKLDGVGLYSNYDGVYLGTPQFRKVFEELNQRRAVVFIHPTQPPGFSRLSVELPAPAIEFPFDSTRMVASLIGSGTLGRCPDLRVIVPHGGGTIPFLAPRMAHFVGMTPHQPAGTGLKEMMAHIQSLFFDLAAATHPGALQALCALVPPTQLLSGFDFPFMPAPSMGSAIAEMNTTKLFSAQDRTAIASGNAFGLLPRLAVRLKPVTVDRPM